MAQQAETEGGEGKDRQFVTALARGIRILQCFDTYTPELSCSELAKRTGLPQPTVWRLCHTLLECGMLVTVNGDKLRPGLAVLQLGYSAISGLSILELARPKMQALASAHGAACGLAIRDGYNMVFVARCEGESQLIMNLRVGSTVPLATSALGWAYIAGQRGTNRAKLLAELRAHDPAAMERVAVDLDAALREYDRHGYIINEGVFHRAYTTVSVPIIDADGSVAYTLNCGAATGAVSAEAQKRLIAPELIALANSLQAVIRQGRLQSPAEPQV